MPIKFKPVKRKVKYFNGKKYTDFGGYLKPGLSYKIAKQEREGGWNARVVKEGKHWMIYRRQTPRTPKWDIKNQNIWEQKRGRK